MKTVWAIMLLGWPLAGAAQGLDLPASTSPKTLPPGCNSATSGRSMAYGCSDPGIGAAAQAQAARGTLQAIGRNTPAPALGMYNRAALREQFGNQLGKSSVPQRPSAPVYTSPLVPH